MIAKHIIPTLAICVISIFKAANALAEPPLLRVSDNDRYLVTASEGEQVFMNGDTGWGLFEVDRDGVDSYLENRASKGFNYVQLMLTRGVAPFPETRLRTNFRGDRPFRGLNPVVLNEPYWSHIDYIIEKAGREELYVFLTPMWGAQFDTHFSVGNPQLANDFGNILGRRYRRYNHIIWITMGEYDKIAWEREQGDRPQPNKREIALINAMANGLHNGHGGRHLQTIHPGSLGNSALHFHDASWLDFNMIQAGGPNPNRGIFTKMEGNYNRSNTKPTMLSEAGYENCRGDGANEMRLQAYWGIFGGGILGNTYGHCKVWGFESGWRSSLNDAGTNDMPHVSKVMNELPMAKMVPDLSQSLISSGVGSLKNESYVASMHSTDLSYAMFYSTRGNTFTVRMSNLTGGSKRARWFDPRDGSFRTIGKYPNTGTRSFDPPGSVSSGNDWILVIDPSEKAADIELSIPGGLTLVR